MNSPTVSRCNENPCYGTRGENLLVRYPDPAQRLAAVQTLDTPNEFLAETPSLAT